MSEPMLKVALVAMNWPGHQSLGLGYVRAYAQSHERLRTKVAFQTLDLDSEMDPWWVAYRVLRMQPDVVGFSVTCWNAKAIYSACELVRTAAPKTVIVLGGPEVGPIAEEVLRQQPAVDMIVRGEGEETFAELLRVLLAGKRAWMCDGVTARNGDEIVSAPDRTPVEDLDSLPSPYLAGVLAPLESMSYLETYRGCPHRCGYCFEAKGSTRIRKFSNERVLAEIEAVATSPGVKRFSFVDSVFNLTSDRLRWLCKALAPYAADGTRLHTVEVDIERIGDEEAALLKQAGVVSVETGPQTVGAKALANSRRDFDPEKFVAGVDALKRAGISVECDLIIGLPGDDIYDVVGGLRWLLNLDPGVVQSSTLRVLPGTPFHTDSKDFGLTFEAAPDHAVIQTETMPFADIRRLEIMASSVQQSYRARVRKGQG